MGQRQYITLSLVGALVVGNALYAKSTIADPIDKYKAARFILDKTVESYAKLQSFSCTLQVDDSGAGIDSQSHSSIVIERPGHAAIKTVEVSGTYTAVTDGKKLDVLLPRSLGGYEETFVANDARAIQKAIVSAHAPSVCVSLLTESRNPLTSILGIDSTLELAGTASVDGVDVQELVGKPKIGAGKSVTLMIGVSDHLLRRVIIETDEPGATTKHIETYTDVRVNPVLPSNAFAFERMTPVSVDRSAVLPVATASTTTPSTGDSYRFDSGEIDASIVKDIDHTFTIRNDSKEPLRLKQLCAACGCTSAIVKTDTPGPAPTDALPTLSPGATAQIHVTVNLRNLHDGPFEKTVGVYAEGNTNAITTLYIAGTLVRSVQFSPTIADFGNFAADTGRSRDITVTFDARLTRAGEMPTIVSRDGLVQAKWVGNVSPSNSEEPVSGFHSSAATTTAARSIRRRLSGHLKISVPAHGPAGLLGTTVSVLTGGGADQSVDLLVFGMASGPIASAPSLAAFGTVERGKPISLELTLTSSHRELDCPVRLLCKLPLSATPGPVIDSGGSSRRTITLSFMPSKVGVLQDRALLKVGDNTVAIPVSANVR